MKNKHSSLHSCSAMALFTGLFILSVFNSAVAVSSILFESIEKGQVETVKSLIRSGASPNLIHEDGNSLLHMAAIRKQPEIVRFLVESGADIDRLNSLGMTPLMFAVWQPDPEIAKLLIDLGADVNVRVEQGVTALGVAVQVSDKETVKALIDKGAQVNVPSAGIAVDNNPPPRAPLFYAVEVEPEIALMLIESGADVNAKDSADSTPLMHASDLDVVEALIKAGADVETKNKGGWTALMYLAGGSHQNRIYEKAAHKSIFRDRNAEILLAKGKKPEEIAKILSLKIAELLLQKGADPNITDKYGKTIIDRAVFSKQTELIELLRKHK